MAHPRAGGYLRSDEVEHRKGSVLGARGKIERVPRDHLTSLHPNPEIGLNLKEYRPWKGGAG
jgi:hypothetical protein